MYARTNNRLILLYFMSSWFLFDDLSSFEFLTKTVSFFLWKFYAENMNKLKNQIRLLINSIFAYSNVGRPEI